MGMGDQEEEVETPQDGRSRGVSQRPGGGWICPNAWLFPPARAEAREQQAGASGFQVLLVQGLRPMAREGRVWNTGRRAGGWGLGRRGRCLDFTSRSWGGEWARRPPCLPGDAPLLVLTAALRAGWVPASSPVGSVERPQLVICRESWFCALYQCLFLSQMGGLSVFATVKGRSERDRLVP